MNYTLNQLQIFLRVTKLKSITKAAAELNLTQPAVSIQLKNFQDQFDVALTEVVGRRLYVTEFGSEIALVAERILEEVNTLHSKSQKLKGRLSGKLKISVVSTGKYVMPFFLSGFIQRNNAVELYMDVTNRVKVIESLEINETDFALVSMLPKRINIERLDLLSNRLFLVGNKPLMKLNGMTKKELLAQQPLIYREAGSGTRTEMERFVESGKFNVLKKIELTSNEAVKQAVIAGLGYSIMPLIGIKNELMNKDLSVITMKGLPIQSTWSLIWLKGKKHSPASVAFLEYLKNERENIVKEYFEWHQNF